MTEIKVFKTATSLWCVRCGDRQALPYTDEKETHVDIRPAEGWEIDDGGARCPCCAQGKHVRLDG